MHNYTHFKHSPLNVADQQNITHFDSTSQQWQKDTKTTTIKQLNAKSDAE